MTRLVLSSVCDGGAASRCGHCTKLQTHTGKPPQAERQRQRLSLSLCPLHGVPYISKRPGDVIISGVDLFTGIGEGICVLASRGCESCVMGLATSWMETLMISSRTERSKLSESAQPAHWHIVLGTWEAIFHLWYVLQGWMNYTRFLGHQTGEMGLQHHVISATVPSPASWCCAQTW